MPNPRPTAQQINAVRALTRVESAKTREIRTNAVDEIEEQIVTGRRAIKELVDHYPEELGLPPQDVPRLAAAIQRVVSTILAGIILASDEALADTFQEAVMIGRQSADIVGIGGFSFSPTSDLLRVAQSYTADQVKSIEASLMPKVNGVLSRAALGNLSPYKAQQEIDLLLGRTGGGASFQARRIVVTELGRINHIVQYEQMTNFAQIMAKQGVKVRKAWRFGPWRPGRREQHRDIDGQTVPWDGWFTFPDGTKARYPNDSQGPPHQTILCGCAFEYFEEELPQTT